MNHGKCINCWWYLSIKGRNYIVTKSGIKEKFGNGKCYMHNSDEGNYTTVEEIVIAQITITEKKETRKKKRHLKNGLTIERRNNMIKQSLKDFWIVPTIPIVQYSVYNVELNSIE